MTAKSDDHNRELNQYYPTYRFTDPSIAIKEYEGAAKTLEAEEKILTTATQMTALIAAAVGYIAIGYFEKLSVLLYDSNHSLTIVVVVALGVFCYSVMSLRYLADRQRAIVFAARKLIVLRRMLGIDYGTQQLILPTWRIEGANEPLSIKFFPGWNTNVTYPLWIVSGFCSITIFFLCTLAEKLLSIDGPASPGVSFAYALCLAALVAIVLALSYRKALCDVHEDISLLAALFFARLFGVDIKWDIENRLYRATLAADELERIGIDYRIYNKLLLFLEDRRFYSHRGIDYRGVLRLLLHCVGKKPRSGGSTISMQLVRTLFISERKSVAKRKLYEFMLARWLERKYKKQEILKMYLASVQFEIGVKGLPDALKHFMGDPRHQASTAEAFFLIERVSNVRSMLLSKKVWQQLEQASAAKLLTTEELGQVVRLYQKMIKEGKLKVSSESYYTKMIEKWAVR